MLNNSDLKNYIIFDNNNKYNEINKKILKITKIYFKTMKNNSFQITQIENKLNEYNTKNSIKIKQLLENQQSIIKDLINIINKILSYKIPTESNITTQDHKIENISTFKDKNDKQSINNLKINFLPYKSFAKNYCMNDETKKINKKNYSEVKINKAENNIIKNKKNRISGSEIKNKSKIISLNIASLKEVNDLKKNSELINMKYLNINKNRIEKKLLDKQLIKKEIELSNKKLFKSINTSEISNKPNVVNHNLSVKTFNLSNSNNRNLNYNYTIDEERNDISLNYDQERQNPKYNRSYNDGSLPNLLFKPNKQKKVKYRSVKSIPLKEEYYLINNYTFTNFNITNTSSYKSIDNSHNSSNNSQIFLRTNINNINNILNNNGFSKKGVKKFYSSPYINNGIQIVPTRYTKEVLNSSYKIINKYKKQRFIKNI